MPLRLDLPSLGDTGLVAGLAAVAPTGWGAVKSGMGRAWKAMDLRMRLRSATSRRCAASSAFRFSSCGAAVGKWGLRIGRRR